MNMLLRIIESAKSVFIFQFSSLNKICYTNLNHLLYTLTVVFNMSKFSLYSTSEISTPRVLSVEYLLLNFFLFYLVAVY